MGTKIEWTDETWNPVSGCDPVSRGCDNCYARRDAQRLKGRFGYPELNPFRVTMHSDRLAQPFRWKRPRKIFVCSMGDLFHPDVDRSFIQDVFATMGHAHRHTFQILTKRPEWARAFLNMSYFPPGYYEDYGSISGQEPWPLPNVQMGVSVEDQLTYDLRVSFLLQIAAAVRFVSCEPLLGRIRLDDINDGYCYRSSLSIKEEYSPRTRMDWVIVGAETGPGARYMDPDWARDIRDQCRAAGVPFFMKSVSRGETIPDDLMIREFPNTGGEDGTAV
ncbi:hypothetical protein ES703_57693 [subsurface metagenome]